MFGFSTSLPPESSLPPSSDLQPSSGDLLREVASCRKRSNILLALTQQDLADAKEWLERYAADAVANGGHPSPR